MRAQNVPAGATLEVRLSTATGSRISHPGDPVEATAISPIVGRGQILIPQGSRLFGSIASVKRFGFGLKQTTARINYEFHTLRLPSGNTIPIHSELLEVETAKERVDVDGTVHGIHPAASISSSLALFTTPLLYLTPAVGAPVWGMKLMVAPSANPEIYFPPGTELVLRLTAPIHVPPGSSTPAGIGSLSPYEESELHRLLNRSPRRARLGRHPSDLVNLLFLGTREEMDQAFQAAGWSHAERKSPVSLYKMYHAISKRMGYKREPMNTLTLNGVPSNLVYQKNLDTVQKRHHVRLWKEPHSANVWLGAAAEDIAFRFELTHWTHATDPNIDKERAKVVNDLVFTRCADAAGLVAGNAPELLQGDGKGRSITTDGDVAVIRLNACGNPKTMPGLETISRRKGRGRWSRALASVRNDLRLNIFFTTFNALKCVTERQASRPFRKTSDIDTNRSGLGWLSSLPIAEQSRDRQNPSSSAISPTPHAAASSTPTPARDPD